MSRELMFIVSAVSVLLLLICVFLLVAVFNRAKQKYDSLEDAYRRLEAMNTEMRSQRHDYLNSLQVVYGMLELEEYAEVREYLKPLYKEYQKTGKALKTSRPAINALLMAKGCEAEKRDIDFFVEVKSDLKELKLPDWELCRVLANLIDNAMTSLEAKADERNLRVDMTESRDSYIFEVSDNGDGIPKEVLPEIFRQGFTTKKDSGHGMGLAIAKKVLEQNEGTIAVRSQPGETVFTVTVAK